MSILERIVDTRLEIVALANATAVAIAQFGFSVTEEQQVAVTGVINAFLIVAYRIVRGAPAVPLPETKG
jgi:hypothetical protein